MKTLQGYFNPSKTKGLASTIQGETADRVIQDPHEFLKAAGRDYWVKKTPAIQRFSGQEYAEVENQFHLVRSSDDRVISPHTVTKQYAPLSLMGIADEVRPWTDAGWATPDAVYEAKGGSLEVFTLRLDAGGMLPADEKMLHYIVILNPHAVGGKAKGSIASFRLRCSNAIARLVRTREIVIPHRMGAGTPEEQQAIMAERTRLALETWTSVAEYIADLSKRIEALSSKAVSFSQAEMLTNKLLGITDLEKTSTRTKNRRDAILAGFTMPQFGTFGKSAWDWYNAVTFVISSPEAPTNKKSKKDPVERAVNTLDPMGSGARLEARAESVLADFLG